MYVACVCDKGASFQFSLSIAIQQTTLNQKLYVIYPFLG